MAENELGVRVCEEAQPAQVSFRAARGLEPAARPAGMETGFSGQFHIDIGDVQLTTDSTYPVEQLAQLLQHLSRLYGTLRESGSI